MIIVLDYPTKDGATWRPTDEQVTLWVGLYPHLDVTQELRKALAWAIANPAQRKKTRGMPRFVVNWLNHATDDRRQQDRRAVVRDTPERRAYQAWIEAGGCPHTPRCPHFTACQVVSGRSKAS